MTHLKTEIPVAPLGAIPPGEGRTFQVAGERIAIFRTREGQLFATQAECPHKNGPLADGLVGGTTVICPLHSWKFDLRSGNALVGDCGLKTYPARIDDTNQIWITLSINAKAGGSELRDERLSLR